MILSPWRYGMVGGGGGAFMAPRLAHRESAVAETPPLTRGGAALEPQQLSPSRIQTLNASRHLDRTVK